MLIDRFLVCTRSRFYVFLGHRLSILCVLLMVVEKLVDCGHRLPELWQFVVPRTLDRLLEQCCRFVRSPAGRVVSSASHPLNCLETVGGRHRVEQFQAGIILSRRTDDYRLGNALQLLCLKPLICWNPCQTVGRSYTQVQKLLRLVSQGRQAIMGRVYNPLHLELHTQNLDFLTLLLAPFLHCLVVELCEVQCLP